MTTDANEGWQKAALKFGNKRGTGKPLGEVAYNWAEYPWTAETCQHFKNEIVDLMADFGKLVAETCAKFYTGYAEPRPELLAAIQAGLEKR
jgi:hypothetical protein